MDQNTEPFESPIQEEIAIIGMAGRFPGANNIAEFWRNLRQGVESIRPFSEEELIAAGISATTRSDPAFVNAGAPLADADSFDADFFGISTREAEIMDPQHRAFLECAWSALEDAGYDPEHYPGRIGVFGGVAPNTYFQHNLVTRPDIMDNVGHYPAMIGREREYAITRAAFKLNLRGPALSVNTACSTSGVATHLAFQSVLSGECDMALVGGARIKAPLTGGYLYEEDGILSPDGHCRAFDAEARGTVIGSGVAMIVIKRLSDALRDGDTVHALIKGTAINNDGSMKIGYTAPSAQGQAAAISEALALAGVSAESISYVEAHGTGTFLGDPIEVAALTKAFREETQRTGYCAIGSVKSNIGHLDAAAGVAGIIKTVLALKHKQLPPSLNFKTPNPQIDFARSPFYVNAQLQDWTTNGSPRRAGVSSFGLGGTNAHVVLEEAPLQIPNESQRPWQLLLLSARSEAALAQASASLAAHLNTQWDNTLADVAYTLQSGRRHFPYRRAIVVRDLAEATQKLQSADTTLNSTPVRNSTGEIVFMFPGGGAQYQNMGRNLYDNEPIFRNVVDECAALLQPRLGLDIRTLLYPSAGDETKQTELESPSLALPMIFTVEYALAKLWQSWGIQPAAMIGHSMGEYAAACLSGVFSLADALALVTVRGQLFEKLPEGSMLSVRLSEAEARKFMSDDLSFAALNLPTLSVISGATASIEQMQAALSAAEIDSTRLHISVAAHSQLVEPILAEFGNFLRTIQFHAPQIPFVSNVSGEWITAEEATDPDYWVRHLRQTVRFADGLQTLFNSSDRILMEVGPGQTLSTFARQHPARTAPQTVVASMRHPRETSDDSQFLLTTLGRLWLAGVEIDWQATHGEEARRRVSLPTYPFERKRYWIDAAIPVQNSIQSAAALSATFTAENLQLSSQEQITMTQTTPVTPTQIARKERLIPEVKEVLRQLSGMDPAQMNENATFLELGFDSLFLTQANSAIRKKFKVKLTFRQLFEEAPTVAALAEYLDRNLPADAFAVEVAAPVQPVAPVVTQMIAQTPATMVTQANAPSSVTTVPASAIERVIEQQLATMRQLMAEQLAMLSNGAAMPTAPSPAISQPATASATPVQKAVPTPAASAPESNNGQANGQATVPAGPWKPVDTRRDNGLTDQQQDHLDQLIARLNARTPTSKRMTQESRAYLADPRTVASFRLPWKEIVYPIVSTRSAGSKIWDVDGNEFIDVAMGFGVNLFGHSPDFITQAVQEQLTHGVEIGPQSPLTGKVAKLLSEFTSMERVAFCNTGSEAVLAALRTARTVTGNNKIVTFSGDYHGLFDEMLARPVVSNGQRRSVPIAPGIPAHMVQDLTVLEYANFESLTIIREMADELAAVIVEPVQSRHPDLQPKEFLLALRQLTSELGIPLIFDEMITGFRSHPGGVQALFGIQADIATYGKVIGGGFPIGVVAGKARFMDALDGGMWRFGDESVPEAGVTWFAGTFVRHPVALTAAHAALQRMKAEGPTLQANLNARTAAFVKELNEHFAANNVPLMLENFSSFFLTKFLSHQDYSSLFYFHLRDQGLHITEGRSAFFSTAHSDADIAAVMRAYKAAAAALQNGGFFPPAPETATEITGRSNEVPLTAGQEEIWLATQVNPDVSCAYNLSNTLRMKGSLQIDTLHAALNQLVARHEALRTSIAEDGQSQIIAPSLNLELPLVDLSTLSVAERESQLDQLRHDDVSTAFDLNKGPLVRATLIKLAADDHLLFLTVHHIVCDGWSVGILLRDLGAIYSALVSNQSLTLSEPMSIGDYARWFADWRTGEEAMDAKNYWLEQFKTPAPTLDLPSDRPRPAHKSYAATRQTLAIGNPLAEQLRTLAAQQGTTLFNLILSAFELFLSRLSGQDELVMGVSIAGQTQFADRDLVGHCINMLPLRRQIDPAASLGTHLRATHLAMLDAFEYQHVGFGEVVKELKLPRDPSRIPLVSVLFNLDSAMGKLNYAGLQVESGSNPRSFENFDWFVNVVQVADGLVLECTHNSDLFDPATIQNRLAEYEALLCEIVANPRQAIASYSMLPEAERQLQLVTWNDTNQATNQSLAVQQRFEAQAAAHSNACAVIVGDQQLSYGELNQRADRLAAYLQAQGVVANQLVGLCVERSLEMVVGLLGILKAGAAYVPMDPAYPQERLAHMLEDSQAKLLLTQETLLNRLPYFAGKIVCLDSEWSTIAATSSAVQKDRTTGESLAYTIYTSGSTGKPKGVQIPHRALSNFLASMAQRPGMSSDDRLLAVTTLSFDIAGLELYLPLCVGGTLVIASGDETVDGVQLQQRLQESGATVMQATPATWRLLIEAGWQGDSKLKILCGGEALPADLAEQLLTRCASLWNMYGPTETTIWSTVEQITTTDEPITLGQPIANTQLYVLDSTLRPVPIGVAGELHIGGDGVALGYLHQPELTASKFVADPFAQTASGRIYKTGDLVRWRNDGKLEFMGRIDHQVKIRGFRIELGEIESVLRQHGAVQECVVVAREDTPGEKRLVAYLTLNQSEEGATISTTLRSHLRHSLPEYMLPSAFVVLDTLPRTPNGKTDRKALPVPEIKAEVVTETTLPRNRLETILHGLWCESLKIENCGIHDDFYDLGGHSLLAARLLNRLRQQMGETIYLTALFDAPTIAQFASYLKEQFPETVQRLTGETPDLARQTDPSDEEREEFVL